MDVIEVSDVVVEDGDVWEVEEESAKGGDGGGEDALFVFVVAEDVEGGDMWEFVLEEGVEDVEVGGDIAGEDEEVPAWIGDGVDVGGFEVEVAEEAESCGHGGGSLRY